MTDFDKPVFDKPVSNTEPGILAKLWRKIITESNLIHVLPNLINKYLDTNNANSRVKSLKRKNRSTIIDNITASEMSIKVFLYLIFKLLRAKSLDITVKVTFQNGQSTLHNVTVDGNFGVDDLDTDIDLNELKKKE